MQQVSAKWVAAIQTHQQLFTQATVLKSGVPQRTFPVVTTSKSGGKGGTTASAGTVSVSATAAQRRSCNFSIPGNDPTLIPTGPGDLLTPYGNEIQLQSGFKYADGTTELVSLGIFGITTVAINDSGSSLEINIQGYDRSQKVSRAAFQAPYQISAGTNVATAVQNIITQAVGSGVFTFNLTPTSNTTPLLLYKGGDDPWKAAQQLALASGYQLYFDVNGVCTMAPIPDTTTLPVVWRFSEGGASTIYSISHIFTNDQVYNNVVVVGEGTGVTTPVQGSAADTNTTSPTYVSGPFGYVTEFIQESSVTTNGQAASSAQSILNQALGKAESCIVKAIPNPAHDVYDCIQVVRSRMNLNENFVVDTMRIPLGATNTQMELDCRKTISS